MRFKTFWFVGMVVFWMWISSNSWSAPSALYGEIFKEVSTRFSVQEKQASQLFAQGKMIETRILSEKIIETQQDSFAAHFYLSFVQYRYEGDILPALWNIVQSKKKLLRQYPNKKQVAFQVLLLFEMQLLQTLGWYKQTLKLFKEYEKLFPKHSLDSWKPWVYMKLGQHMKGVRFAKKLIREKKNVMSAYNGLCAIYFEMGDRRQSIEYCKKGVELALKNKDSSDLSTHYYNLSEAFLGVLDFLSAEKTALESSQYFDAYSYSNPWRLLTGIYLEQERLNDSWNALRQSQKWFHKQKPILSESLFASQEMAKAVFFLLIGKDREVDRYLQKIEDRPDRDGHQSGKALQQNFAFSLLQRKNTQMKLQRWKESYPFWSWKTRLQKMVSFWKWTFQVWILSKKLKKGLLDPKQFSAIWNPFGSGGVTMPNTNVPTAFLLDTFSIVGGGISFSMLKQIQGNQKGSVVFPLFKGFEAYALFLQQKNNVALQVLQSALQELPSQLVSFRLSLECIRYQILRKLGRDKEAFQVLSSILRKNGYFLRFWDISIPVQIRSDQPSLVSTWLEQSPRFYRQKGAFILWVKTASASVVFRLIAPNGSQIVRLQVLKKKQEKDFPFSKRAYREFLDEVFLPQIELVKQNAFSLDGSPFGTSSKNIRWKKLWKKKD